MIYVSLKNDNRTALPSGSRGSQCRGTSRPNPAAVTSSRPELDGCQGHLSVIAYDELQIAFDRCRQCEAQAIERVPLKCRPQFSDPED